MTDIDQQHCYDAMKGVLEAVEACQYDAASNKLVKTLRHHKPPADIVWAYAILLGRLRSLKGPAEDAGAIFLDLPKLFPGRGADLRIAMQLTLFYHLLENEGERSILESIISEVDLLDRQLGNRYRAGVLCARACLYEATGELETAVENLEKAWSSSNTLGGLCTTELAISIVRISTKLENSQQIRVWGTLIDDFEGSTMCCRLRRIYGRLLLGSRAVPALTQTDILRMISDLAQVECPSLVSSSCAALLRMSVVAEWTGERPICDEVGMDCERLLRNVQLSQRARFELLLSKLDWTLAKMSQPPERHYTPEMCYGVESELLYFLQTSSQKYQPGGGKSVLSEGIVQLYSMTCDLALALDHRLRCNYYRGLVQLRTAVITRYGYQL